MRLAAVLVVLLAFFALVKTENFFSLPTWQSMAIQFPEFGLMALGVMLAMVIGGIDLSVVGVANMTAIGSATLMLWIAPVGSDAGQGYVALVAAIGLSLLVGALAGALNGFLVAKVRIPAILVTLGTFELFTGIAVIISGGKPTSGLPPQYGEVMASRLFGLIPMPLIIFVVATVLVGLLMYKTAFGTKLYMLGSNETAASFSGLKTTSLTIRTYMLSGVLASAAGLVMLANYNSAKADYGSTYTLLAVLIVVLGGINPNGGSGRLSGVVLAVVVLQVLSSLLNTFPQVSSFYRPLIWGAVLLLVIVVNQWDRKGNLNRFFRWKGKDA
ncbi:ABC transporter permease [Microbacterium sp. zg.Y625]|uniref:ABC transporter permease n=1 Tax=Microbacterium jiangjiandongii TaxID=3049071 RepID=UPI00214CA192|nr:MULTISPECIES: ABC transporter permease [unclassified Microbacterium]MCR2792294.1 ABC transporter permease [Microbacterium sp. zg.Y625]WIM25090.1 ABC transporter permease [Microbacterium sp. zg-Y625]